MIDLADIIVTYLKELYPMAHVEKKAEESIPEVHIIEVNGNYIGLTIENRFATWDLANKNVAMVKATDKDLFNMVLHWAIVKGGLSPKTSQA